MRASTGSEREGLAHGLLASGVALFSFALLLLPQQLAQRPAHAGVVVIHLAADGGLRLWNRAILPQQLPALLAQARRINPGARVRIVPDATTPWGVVQQLLPLLEVSALPFEVQLPPAGGS